MIRLGHRLNPCAPAADPAVLDALRGIVTPHLSDNLNRSVGTIGLTRYNKTGKLAGAALTVKTRPGDNLYVYKALTMVRPGDVLVIDAGGDLNNAIIGDLMTSYAVMRGCAGVVVDGAVRDVESFADIPCYARGVTHRGPYKTGPGEINVPVAIGGQVVNPGDILVGDEDGLVCFPAADAAELIVLARRHAAAEEAVKAEIATGAASQSWIDKVLEAAGLDGAVA
ncbi:RraA family protein [Oleispirillum naphthae]|uniref:RraA family protein n=1 Tax=Oleispirillum naphthae TaxID=2838853 RepID=UPI0030822CDA